MAETNFTLGEEMADDGTLAPAYGFVFADMFITDPYVSECGRFKVAPNYYGLTDEQAQRLRALNANIKEGR